MRNILPMFTGIQNRKWLLLGIVIAAVIAVSSLRGKHHRQDAIPAPNPIAGVATVRGAGTAATSDSHSLAAGRISTTKPSDDLLFEPDSPNAPGEWSLPAELKASEVQNLIAQVDVLSKDVQRCMFRIGPFHQTMRQLLADDVRDALWERLVHNGYRDTRLPLDWYKLVEDDYLMADDAAAFINQTVEAAFCQQLSLRLRAAKVRLLGGRALVADVLLVKGARSWVDSKNRRFDEAGPLINDISKRLQVEFRK
jgi:hypothetical protein